MALVQDDISYKIAVSTEDFNDGKRLFLQYAQSIDIDLGFQGFDKELEIIHQQYNKPSGALLLAYAGELPVGCAAIRPIDEEHAELKRMFVQPEYRQYKIGRKLMELIIEKAAALQYKYIRLDTLPTMTSALGLYRSFGFYEIPPYRFNPVEGAVYMEKKLEV